MHFLTFENLPTFLSFIISFNSASPCHLLIWHEAAQDWGTSCHLEADSLCVSFIYLLIVISFATYRKFSCKLQKVQQTGLIRRLWLCLGSPRPPPGLMSTHQNWGFLSKEGGDRLLAGQSLRWVCLILMHKSRIRCELQLPICKRGRLHLLFPGWLWD